MILRLHRGGPLQGVDGLLPATLTPEHESNTGNDLRVIGTTVSCEAEFAQGKLVVVLSPVVVVAPGAVSLGQGRVDLVGALGRRICGREPWRRAVIPEVEHQAVVFAERRVGDCEIRIECGGSLEKLLCELEFCSLEAPAISEAMKISLVGFQILGRPRIERPSFYGVDLNADIVNDGVGDC